MAKNSIIEYVGDGSTIQYTINFTGGYTSEDHVFCQVNNEVDGSLDPVYRTLTFISAGLVSIGGTTPALDDPIVFSRVTPIATPVVDFEDGVVFTETDIDAGFEQVLFGIQEAQDNLQDAVATEAALAAALVAQAAAELAETNAGVSETNVAADLVLTNADVVLTNADAVLTAADVVTSAANAAAAAVAKIEWQGTYAGGTTYAVNDAVVYNSSSYICILASTGNLPTNGTYWDILALKGTDGAGSGDMLVATYDPTAVGGDAFDMDNMTEGSLTKVMTGVERSKLAGIEAGATAGGGGIVYEEQTTTYTAVSNTGYRADTSSAAWTLTLPASPANNDVIVVREQGGWSTNNLTIARNGNNIQGLAEDLTCDLDGVEISLVYDTSDTNWSVTTTNPSVANALSDVLTISAQTLTDAQKIQKRADFGSSAVPDAVIEDQKASGTDGGTFTSGAWQKRDLNTEVRDPDGLVTITSSEFTPTVDGWVEWSSPSYKTQAHISRLYNVTDSAVVGYSTAELTSASQNIVTITTGGGAVVASKTYRIEHRCSTTRATNGFGAASSLGTEVYTRLKFWRI